MPKQKLTTVFLLLTIVFGVSAQVKFNNFDENNQRHGPWKKYYDGTKLVRYEGTFSHGEEVGTFKFYKKLGKINYLAATKEFNEDGTVQVIYYSLGKKVISEGKMVGEKLIGNWLYYHKDSDQVMTSETYDEQGILHGVKQIYYPHGQLTQEVNYVHGKRENIELYYAENGTIIKKYHYENDQLHGLATHFNDRGDKILEGTYKRDKRTGLWKWYQNGRVVKEKDYTYIPKFKKKQ